MKLRITILTAAIILLPVLLAAQGTRINDRIKYAMRAGLAIGSNLSLYNGDVPVRPEADNSFYSSGHGANFTVAGFIEKPFSPYLVLGAALAYEPMGGDIDATFTEPFRVADANGQLYQVVRNYRVDYSIHYLTLAGYAKVYPIKNSGAFMTSGLRVSTMLKDLYYYNTATVKEPDQYLGAVYAEGNSVDHGKPIRFSLDVGIGYEIRTTYVFITPEVHYDIGLSKVIDTSWSDNWRINNLRLILSASFPVVTL